MIKHIWSILCSKSVIDRDSNNISLYDVFEQLSVEIVQKSESQSSQEKVIPIDFELVTLWVREDMNSPAHGKSKLILYSPTGKENKAAEIEIDLSKHHRTRSRIHISGLPINSGSGYYWFVLFLRVEGEEEWREVSRIPLQVEVKMEQLPKVNT